MTRRRAAKKKKPKSSSVLERIFPILTDDQLSHSVRKNHKAARKSQAQRKEIDLKYEEIRAKYAANPNIRIQRISEQWHLLSRECGGIFILRIVKSFAAHPRPSKKPYDVLTYGQLIEKFGERRARSMARACYKLGIESQEAFSREQVAKYGVRSISPELKKILRKEKIKFKKYANSE